MQCAGDIFAIKNMLLGSVDKKFNVVDHQTISQVLDALEAYPVTKVELEQTRIGKCINEVRKQTQDQILRKRAKDLVKKWQRLINSHASKPQISSPATQLLSHVSKSSVFTPTHSNSCSPVSDPAASPAIQPNNKHKYANGINKQVETLCTCNSFEEHISKCEKAKPPSDESDHNLNNAGLVNLKKQHENHLEIPNSNNSIASAQSGSGQPSESKHLQTQKVTTHQCSTLPITPDSFSTHRDGLNGNVSVDGDFNEWHEIVTRGSSSEPLFVLPYTVLD